MLMSIFGSSPSVFVMKQNNAFEKSFGVMLVYFMISKHDFYFKMIASHDSCHELFDECGWLLFLWFFNGIES